MSSDIMTLARRISRGISRSGGYVRCGLLDGGGAQVTEADDTRLCHVLRGVVKA